MSLSESCIKALEKMGEIVFPDKIEWKDISKHMKGYDKEKAIGQMVEAAKRDPAMTRLKLFMLYTELQHLANNGGLE